MTSAQHSHTSEAISRRRFCRTASGIELASAIANGRIAHFKHANTGRNIHARVLNHGWFSYKGSHLATAFLTIGMVCPEERRSAPLGEQTPTPELAAPGGMTPENFTLPSESLRGPIEESSSFGDIRDPSAVSPGIFLVSYGEYIPSCEGVDYTPFVKRAEDLARFHFPFLPGNAGSSELALKIVRREWFCVPNPDIAVVHIYIQAD
jgi:hypothetical protein